MALNQLSEKLDQLSGEELGFEFDENLVWSKLENKLDKGKVRAYWWAVAASLVVALLFIPLSFVNDSQIETTVLSHKEELKLEVPAKVEDSNPKVESTPKEQALTQVKKPLMRKGTAPVQMVELPVKELLLVPIAIEKQDIRTKPVFAAKDISIIQASLEKPPIENGRTMTIRAQWQKSPDELNVNHQTLKIKLYEKHQ